MDRRVTPPKRVTSPTWGPPPPCKQALKLINDLFYVARHFFSAKLSPEWRLNLGFWKPQKVSLSPK